MLFLRVLPAEFCLLLIAVLAMRLGFPLVMIVPLTGMLMVGLLIPWAEVRGLMTGVVALCAMVWGVMTSMRIELRVAYEQPFIRLAFILGTVTAFNAWAAWLVWSTRKACLGAPAPAAEPPEVGR